LATIINNPVLIACPAIEKTYAVIPIINIGLTPPDALIPIELRIEADAPAMAQAKILCDGAPITSDTGMVIDKKPNVSKLKTYRSFPQGFRN
jgi:hypothetical protein